jgi:CMP-N-acetylneuraminic acid synthetase
VSVVALICARGGSKRIPRKNVAMCAGKHLIEWPLIAAQQAKCIDRIFVSTEDAEIKQIGRDYGAEIIDRPWQLATDLAYDGSLVYHAYSEIISRCGAEYICKLHATSPCIEPWHIDEAYELLLANKMAVSVGTMHKQPKPSQMNNYYTLLPNKTILKVFPDTLQGVNVYITNNLVDLYYNNGAFGIERLEPEMLCLAVPITADMDSVYVNDLYASYQGRIELRRNIEARNIKLGYVMDAYSGQDINYPEDLIMAEAIIKYREEKRNGRK